MNTSPSFPRAKRLARLSIIFIVWLGAIESRAQAPTTGATNFSVTNIFGNSMRVNWTRGNGGNVLVVASADASFNGAGIPANGTDYTANTIFGSGNTVGAGNFVVYKSTSTNVTISGLSHSTTYYFRIYEFNGTGTGTQYNTANVLAGNAATLFPPTTGSTNLTTTPITGNAATLTWTRGNGTRVLVILQVGSSPDDPTQYTNYSASPAFGSGTAIGSGRVVYFNTGNTVPVTNLEPNTQYFYKVVEANGTSNSVFNLATTLVGSFTTGGAPTTGASNFSVPVANIDGNRLRVNWTRGNGSNVLVVASLSPTFNGTGIPANATDYVENAAFGLGDQIGTGNFVVYRSTGTGVNVTGLVHSTTYYFRIYEFNGTNFNTVYNTTNVLSGNGTTLLPPTVGSTNFAATPTGNTASLTWTRGNGTRSLVILQAGSPAADPVQYSNYGASTFFGSGAAAGSGYVVYFNSGNTANVTNLQPNTQYFYRIVESNGTSGPVFDLAHTLTGSFFTVGAPTSGSSNFASSNIQGDRFSINFTGGNGTQRLIVARQDLPVAWTPADGVEYNVNAIFGNGDNLGSNTFAVGKTTGANLTITGLTPATTYYIAVFEYNGAATNTFYLIEAAKVLSGQVTTLSPPSTSAGNFSFTAITGHSATITFTAGNGNSRLVLVKAGSAVTDVPVTLVNYTANGNIVSAPSLGASKIVYEGAGLTFNLSALQPNTTYHFAIFEYNGSTGPVYKQADPGTGSFVTLGKPTIAPTNLTYTTIQGDRFNLNYTTGNGFGRIVIAKQGAPVDIFPVDFTTYTASTAFGTASAHLGGGNYVIQNNTAIGGGATATSITGLGVGQQYYFAIIEYNGTGAERIYMASAAALTGSNSTLSPPTLQATNVTFSNITSNTLTVNWQNGNGDARMVLIREGQAVQDLPANLANYSASFNYPNSPGLGTGRIVYDGTGSSVNITTIPPGQYHVAIIEYNGTSQPVYRTVDPLRGSVLVGDKPPIAATNLTFSNIEGNQMSLSFTPGNGISRMIIAKAGSPVDAWPVDFTGYTSNGNFGSGANLGGGNFVVGSGTGSIYSISNLMPNSTYHFAVVEYNGTGATSFYQLPSIVATDSRSTLSAPTVTTSSFFANNINGNSMQLTWTRGNGTSRLIVAKAGSPVDIVPADLSNPSSSTSFGSSTNLGGNNYAVYENTGDNFILTNLEPGTTYHFAFFEYNGSTGRVYLTDPVGRSSFTTAPRPSVAPKNLSVSQVNGDRFTISFAAGNGTRRLVVLRKGGLVNEVPVDLTTYTGGAFGTGTLLANGNYATSYIINGSTTTITGLEPDTPYGVAVFEVDGSNGNQRYLITEYINQIVMTASPPTISTNALLYNSLGSNSVNLSWTAGNGQGRMVVLTAYQPVTFQPTVLSTHGSSSANYASTSNNLPNAHKHIYRGTATTVTITNLAPGTTYHIAIFEYNGLNQPVYTSVPLRGFFTTLPTSGIAIGGFDAITFCPAQQVDVPYVFTGVLGAGNQLSVELSDITGSFSSATVLGIQSSTNASGFITSTLPVSLQEGIGYRLRVRATNPISLSTDNGANLQITTSIQPTFTVVGGQTSSCGTPIQLSTSQPGYNLQWFRNSQPIPFATNSSYFATQTGSYQVRIAGASGGCQLLSASTALTITNTPAFNLQFAPQYCINSIIDLTPLTSPSGGTLSGPGITNGVFNSSVAGIGQHFVTYTYIDPVSLCSYSETTYIKVFGLPAAPTVAGGIGCQYTGIVLNASGANATESYTWYSSATGGTAISGEFLASFTTPPLNITTSYYVSILSVSGCEGPRTEVIATVTPSPAAPTVLRGINCSAGTVTLTAQGASDGRYRWYEVATGGTALTDEVNSSFVTPLLNISTDYYVAINNGTCESARTKITAEIGGAICTNKAPVIAEFPISTQVGGNVTVSLTPFLSDPDDNLDLSTLRIIASPISGALASIDATHNLVLDYQGISFSGTEKFTIEVCDLFGLCVQKELSIEVAGDIIVYNGISPNGDQKNEFLIFKNIELISETKSNHVFIYNRWGDLLFDVANYDNSANVFRGLNNNGSEIPSGTYFYKINFTSGLETKSGYLYLKR